jgi:hypothetical protein
LSCTPSSNLHEHSRKRACISKQGDQHWFVLTHVSSTHLDQSLIQKHMQWHKMP